MTAQHDDDHDGDANCGIHDVTSSFYLCNDDDNDGNRHQKNNAVITIWPIPLITPSLGTDSQPNIGKCITRRLKDTKFEKRNKTDLRTTHVQYYLTH